MPGCSIRKCFVLFACFSLIAVGAVKTSSGESPRLVVRAFDGEAAREFSEVPVCAQAAGRSSRVEDIRDSGPSRATAAHRMSNCPIWIGDGRSAPTLVTSSERPGMGVVLLPAPSEITATLTDLQRSVESKNMTLEGRWRARGGGEWISLPSQLLRFDRDELPRLRIGALPAGYIELQVQAETTTYELPRVLLEPGGWADLGKVKPKRRFVVCGEVVDWTREMEGLAVHWSRANEEGAQKNQVNSFQAGHFCLPELEDGPIWVWGEGAGWSSEPLEVQTASFAVRELKLSMSRDEHLRVSWLPPQVDKAELEIYRELTVGPRKYVTRLAGATVSEGGRVPLPRHRPLLIVAHPAEPGSLSLASSFQRIEHAPRHDHQREAVFDFQPASRFHGVVQDETDEAVEGATILAALSGVVSELPFRMKTVMSDADGSYELAGLPAGEYEVVVRRAGFLEKRLTSRLSVDDSLELNLALSRGERIEGVIVDASSDRPVVGANVQLVGDGIRSTWTMSDGRFGFDSVSPGTYSLKADAEGRRQAHERVVVAQGRSPNLRVEMSSGTRWLTRVVGFSGEPSQITILRASEHYSAPVAADGRFVLENGPDGLVGFTLTASDGTLICTGGVEVPRGAPLMNSDVPCNSSSRTDEP